MRKGEKSSGTSSESVNAIERPKPARVFRTARERMDPQQAVRQGEVARKAFAAFGDRTRALAFLNGDNAQLRGRPIDLAVASDGGLQSVLVYLEASPEHGGPDHAWKQAAAAHLPLSPTD